MQFLHHLKQSSQLMEYVGNERFNLSYMRHTQKWWEIYQELTITECLKLIVESPHFIP